MEKTKVIVDTCFLQRLSSEGRNVTNVKRVLDELEYIPVVHPYISEHELSLHSYLKHLIDEGYIQVIPYSEFQKDESDEKSYRGYFEILYEDLRQLLEALESPKQMEKLNVPKGQTIYTMHKQGSSIGDVHMMLMAAFMQMPVILTDDGDIDNLREIARRRMGLSTYALRILNGVDVIMELAKKKESSITAKELESILKDMRARDKVSEVKEIWRENHNC